MGKRSREKQERRIDDQRQSGLASQHRSGLEKIYLYIIEWGTYLALFTPLVLARHFFFPYVTPKTIFFRIIIDIIFIAYVLLAVSNPRYRPKINALTIAIAVFLAIIVISSVFGANFEKSFWSVFERMAGLLTFLHLFAFFIVLTSVFRERKYWERILTVSILVGVILSFYVFNSTDPTARGGGTLGNTSFMSAYIIFNVFFALILFMTKSGGWRILYGAALILMVWLLLSPPKEPTQAAIGAFWGGIFILVLGYLFYYLFFFRRRLLKWLAPAFIVLIILAGIGAFQTDFLKEKFAEFRYSGSFQSRLIVWDMAWQGWQERFWLGWGQENFNLVFTEHFDPRLPLPEFGSDVWYDRVHNVVFDTVVTSGILGLLSYLAIFGVAVFGLLRKLPKVSEKRNAFFLLGMIAVLAVYFAQNLFVFDMISSYMMFFLSLAFIYFLIKGDQSEEQAEIRAERARSRSFLGALLILIAAFTLYYGNIQPARASNYLVAAISLPLEKAIPNFQKALETSPISQFETPEQISRKLEGLVFNEQQDKELLEHGFELAAEELEKSVAKQPLDFRLYLALGRHYNYFYHLTQKEEKLELSEKYLEKAVELSPRNQQVYWSFSQTKLNRGEVEEGVSLMQKAVDLEPRFGLSHWYLAVTYRALGATELALEEVKAAEEAGYNWKASLEDLKKVIGLHQELQNDQELVPLYLLAIEKDPQNAQLWAGLAVAYANVEQFDKAREHVQKAIGLNPDYAKEFEEFLRQLPE